MGLNDRIERNYFLYRDVSFLAEKKSIFFLIFWLPLGPPGVPGPKIVKIIFIYFYGIRETGIQETEIRGVIVTRDSVISSETAW